MAQHQGYTHAVVKRDFGDDGSYPAWHDSPEESWYFPLNECWTDSTVTIKARDNLSGIIAVIELAHDSCESETGRNVAFVGNKINRVTHQLPHSSDVADLARELNAGWTHALVQRTFRGEEDSYHSWHHLPKETWYFPLKRLEWTNPATNPFARSYLSSIVGFAGLGPDRPDRPTSEPPLPPTYVPSPDYRLPPPGREATQEERGPEDTTLFPPPAYAPFAPARRGSADSGAGDRVLNRGGRS